ncbi:MAG: hypothetical protein IAI50_19000 [Candidatus Eremiobacteraeota bacterium]|nr:hypothetical protein [Candidatus Eremiobacteraeota bacterium]
MGYACELQLLGFEPFGSDPLELTLAEAAELAEHVRKADKKRQAELARWQRKKEKASKIPERSKRVSAR